ncbi:expressed unknown protein [Seminavis robusta]|uniref:Uncharacterized protein n=1 Tax=Seminavis robusta TaxID=568900 RepID=A0A9N8D973_9STRA|nr:expressed unknown protein [Seminavis robusta]|eukprot:Sro38_g023750.1 n/a (522) ;mRNA; f:86009-87574
MSPFSSKSRSGSRRFYSPFFSSGSSSTQTLTVTARSPSHVVVDLACPRVKDAVGALVNLKPLCQKVRSATVHANTLFEQPGRFGRIQFEMSHVLNIFEKLAALPNLTCLSIEMNYHVISLPVQALLTIMAKKQLKRLTLKHLQMIGTCMEEFQMLADMAAQQDQLHSLTLECVRGVSGVQALVQHLPKLSDLRMSTTTLTPAVCNNNYKEEQQQDDAQAMLSRETYVKLLTTGLHTLKLDDIAEFDDQHCHALAEALALPGCQLQELHLSSSMLCDSSAKAMTDMLLVNTSLKKVTLHIDSELMGQLTANLIKADTPVLKHLDIRLYNDIPIMTEDCIELAHALRRNTHLTHLRIRLEIELELLPREIIQAFEDVVANTPTVALQSLSLDDGIYRYPLPAAMKLQLQLNQCGVRALLQQPARTVPQLVDTLVVACTQQTTLDATFTLLSNMPELIHLALEQGNLDGDNNEQPHNNDDTTPPPPTKLRHSSSKEWKKIAMMTRTSLRSPYKKVVKMLIPPSA